MDQRWKHETVSRPYAIGLYGAAIMVALGAAAIAGSTAFSPAPVGQPQLVVGQFAPARPDRIAGIIEPVTQAPSPAIAQPTQPASPAPRLDARPPKSMAGGQPVDLATISPMPLPPKPLPRPCLECAQPVAAVAAAPLPVSDADGGPPTELAALDDGVPIPPMPIVARADDGAEPGLFMRGGRAVVEGGSQLVGSAWTLSGAAVGGLVRGVRHLTF